MAKNSRHARTRQGLVIPVSRKAREELEVAWKLLSDGKAFAAKAEFEQARECVGYASQLFERHRGAPESAFGSANCQLTTGFLLWRFGDTVSALRTLTKARHAWQKLGDEGLIAECHYWNGVVLATLARVTEASEHLHRARRVFARLKKLNEVARSDVALSKIARHEGRSSDAETLLAGALDMLKAKGSPMDIADAREALAILYISDGRYAESEPLLRECLRVFASLASIVGIATSESLLARALSERGETNEALALALSAIRNFDRLRYQLKNPVSRRSWATHQHGAQLIALRIAVESGDAPLAAELIESARTQAIPEAKENVRGTGPQQPDVLEERPLPGATAVDALPLAAVRPVSVGGKSKLGGRDAGDAVELTTIAAEFGGDGSWWWGSWQIGGRLWWSLCRPNLDVEAGSIDVSEGSAASVALREWYGALPLRDHDENSATMGQRVRNGPLLDRRSEEALSDRLGDLLLPPSLRAALQRCQPEAPMSLVVAPCGLLGRIPIPALGVGCGRRVVEAAIVRMAPAIGLVSVLHDECRAGLRLLGGPGDVTVGVFNPAAGQQLPHAQRLQSMAQASIALSEKTATRTGLSEALRTANLRPGQPGVFVYAGHARLPAPGVALMCLHRPRKAPLRCPIGDCCGGDQLAVSDLMESSPTQPGYAYPMPGRVLLAACDTAGAALSDASGEWIGLAPAFLWAGARLVIATLWPTLDHPHALAFETSVINALKHDDNPDGSLRALQLDHLRRWRQDDCESAPNAVPAGTPLIWAAYAAIGFASA